MMFSDKVREIVRNIPKGETRTYQQVAKSAGRPRAYRAVGSIMSKNYDPAIPCHRVVKSDATLGNYNRGGPLEKAKILRDEGVLA